MAQVNVKAQAAVGIAKESVENTAVAPTRFLNVLSESFSVDHDVIKNEGLSANPTTLRQVASGALSVKGALSLLAAPDKIGEILKAAFGSEGTGTASGVGTHTFLRLGSGALPTWTVWKDTKIEEFEYTALQCSKLSIEGKAKEAWKISADWVGRGEGTSLGTQAVSYGTVQPFVFSQTTFTLNGTSNANIDSFNISLDNACNAEHTIGSTRYPQVIWSERLEITGGFDIFFQNLTERNLFLNGSRTAINVAIVHDVNVTGAIPYRLELDLPDVFYSAFPAPVVDSVSGPFKASVGFVAPQALGSSYGIQARLVNASTSLY